jgi:hypothetical protein
VGNTQRFVVLIFFSKMESSSVDIIPRSFFRSYDGHGTIIRTKEYTSFDVALPYEN